MIPINKALEILSAQWLIEQNYVMSQLPLLYAFLNGQSIDTSKIASSPKPYIISGSANINTADRWDLMYDGDEIPYNSVAIIPVQGPIMSWNTMNLIHYLALAEANERIVAILLLINSPGGMVQQIDNLSMNVVGLKKPVVTYVVGMACSAASWLISGSKRIIASSQMDSFGSVGTMLSAKDFSGLFEKMGIKELLFYARKSTEKNQPIRDILDANVSDELKKLRTEELLDKLDFINDIFHADIMKNLQIKKDSPVFTGKVFLGKEAINYGLCHEINTLQYSLEYAHHEGMKHLVTNK